MSCGPPDDVVITVLSQRHHLLEGHSNGPPLNHEVARLAGERAGAPTGAAVKAAVDSAFIDGFRAGSWVSAGVVLIGAMIALRWLPSGAVAQPFDVELVGDLEIAPVA